MRLRSFNWVMCFPMLLCFLCVVALPHHACGHGVFDAESFGGHRTIFDVTQFGAVGDGITDDSASIIGAIVAAASSPTPSTVLFPKNHVFLTGPLNLSSYMCLQVDGTLRAISGNNSNISKEFFANGRWPEIPPLPSYGDSRDGPYLQYQAFIYAKDASNIALLGSGTIDGQGDWWWTNKRNRSVVRSGRPNLLQFVNCTDVLIAGITLRDSPFWCVHPVYCTNVHIHHVTIRARMYAPNSDGIDPDSSRNVMIENNDVSCGDDNIAIKAGVCGASSPNSCHDPKFTNGHYETRNVTVRRNIFRIGMGIAVGSESSGGIRDIHIYDNIVGLCEHGDCQDTCCGWGPGLHLKTAVTRGSVIEHVIFRNNTVYNNTGFISLETTYQSRDKPPTDYPPTSVKSIAFIDNKAVGGGWGASWACSQYSVCSDIRVIGNTVLHSQHPWSCHYVDTYYVADNYPDGLEACMWNSMNRTQPNSGSLNVLSV
eukprot:TRINITY_DN46979_c0_g1_i2.p1 TRINITY_DN46979_c0_g1~~TRINITY_DN46979_c0_g1_i2.p1  ORF type:complete len:502 (-),score=35.68 TRINITY_DN46979_c0_g1_i2:192-1640(-)